MPATRILLYLKAYALIFILLGTFNVYAQFAGGSGTQTDPYLVQTVTHLSNVRYYLSDCFRQIADIDLNVAPYNQGVGWLPIRQTVAPFEGFQGRYEGGGYNISNLYINNISSDGTGLFAEAYSATLDSIVIINADITSHTGVGSLVGNDIGSLITNCHAIDCTVNGISYFGGLIGNAIMSTITQCYATGDVIQGSSENVGGLIGRLIFNPRISYCYATGNVIGQSSVGGLIGSTFVSNPTISNCFAKGNCTGQYFVGGLIGRSYSDVENCYSTGFVNGTSMTGGLVGDGIPDYVINSYWDTQTSGQTTSVGGEGRSTTEMTFPYSENTYIGWDFDYAWQER
jgi:hypothetical protein